jgi:hypothetical protein
MMGLFANKLAEERKKLQAQQPGGKVEDINIPAELPKLASIPCEHKIDAAMLFERGIAICGKCCMAMYNVNSDKWIQIDSSLLELLQKQ